MKNFKHLKNPPMLVAMTALFVALGGTSYAAYSLPKNSVGAAQIKAAAVRTSEVKNGSLKSVDFADGEGNDTEPILNLVPDARRHTLISQRTADGTWWIDINLQGENETVFFDI